MGASALLGQHAGEPLNVTLPLLDDVIYELSAGTMWGLLLFAVGEQRFLLMVPRSP
jgi:hypothetical protein